MTRYASTASMDTANYFSRNSIGSISASELSSLIKNQKLQESREKAQDDYLESLALKEQPDGLGLRVEFVAKKSGFYDVEIKLGDEAILEGDSKFKVYIRNSKADFVFSQIIAVDMFGGEIRKGQVIKKEIDIIAKDQYRNPCEVLDPEEISIEIKIKESGKAVESLGQLKVIPKHLYLRQKLDKGEMTGKEKEKFGKMGPSEFKEGYRGIYAAPYEIKKAGLYQLHVNINSIPVVGSPYLINYNKTSADMAEEIVLEMKRLEAEKKAYEERLQRAREEDMRKKEEEHKIVKAIDDEEYYKLQEVMKIEMSLKKAEEERMKIRKEESQIRELRKREIIMRRIKNMQELEKKSEEELKAAEEKIKMKISLARQLSLKRKRTGGGFSVQLGDNVANVANTNLKMQNYMKN